MASAWLRGLQYKTMTWICDCPKVTTLCTIRGLAVQVEGKGNLAGQKGIVEMIPVPFAFPLAASLLVMVVRQGCTGTDH